MRLPSPVVDLICTTVGYSVTAAGTTYSLQVKPVPGDHLPDRVHVHVLVNVRRKNDHGEWSLQTGGQPIKVVAGRNDRNTVFPRVNNNYGSAGDMLTSMSSRPPVTPPPP